MSLECYIGLDTLTLGILSCIPPAARLARVQSLRLLNHLNIASLFQNLDVVDKQSSDAGYDIHTLHLDMELANRSLVVSE